MGTLARGGYEQVDLLGRVEVEACHVVGLAQPLDLRNDVENQAEVLDGVLEDGVRLCDNLVDRLSLARAVLGELVAPLFDLLGGDRLYALGSELGEQVCDEDRSVIDLRAGRPVTLERSPVEPVPGDVRERITGALLAQLPASSVDEDLVEAFFGLSFAQEALRGRALARPVGTETLLVLALLVAPLGAPGVAALAFIQPHVAADRGVGIECSGCHKVLPWVCRELSERGTNLRTVARPADRISSRSSSPNSLA